MGVPLTGELLISKIARERIGFGYDSASSQTNPIYFSDLHRLTGGNTSGSGNSYPAINLLNPSTQRPDGSNPLSTGEFRGYDQNVTRTAFEYQEGLDANDACTLGLPSGDTYYHTDINNLYPDALDGTYTAYTTETGSTTVSAGYYQVFDTSGNSTNKYIQVGSNGSIIGGGSC